MDWFDKLSYHPANQKDEPEIYIEIEILPYQHQLRWIDKLLWKSSKKLWQSTFYGQQYHPIFDDIMYRLDPHKTYSIFGDKPDWSEPENFRENQY